MAISPALDINFLLATTGAMIAAVVAVTKHIEAVTDRKREALERTEVIRKAELERAETLRKAELNAEVEKERIKAEAEVEKARERSVGAEAVLKLTTAMGELQKNMDRIDDWITKDDANHAVLHEIIHRLQEDYKRVMDALMKNFKL